MNLYLGFKEPPPQWVLEPSLIDMEFADNYIAIMKALQPRYLYLSGNIIHPLIVGDEDLEEVLDFAYLIRIDSQHPILAWQYIELSKLRKIPVVIDINTIKACVAQELGIPESDLNKHSKSRRPEYVYFRYLVMIFAYVLLKGTSMRKIGIMVGRKDHATVLHACKKIEEGYQTKADVRRNIYHIANNLGISTAIIEKKLFGGKVKILA